MPMKRGHVSAPQNTFIDTIIKKFDSQSRRFLIANARLISKPTIYCNDAFYELTGFNRADVLQKPCTCEFLYGPETCDKSIKQICHALQGSVEKEVDIILYKKTGVKFWSNVLIAPVKNESCDIILFILEFMESENKIISREIPRICNYTITETNGIRKRPWLRMINPIRYLFSRNLAKSATRDGTSGEDVVFESVFDDERSNENQLETVIKKNTMSNKAKSFIPNISRRIAQILSLNEDPLPDFRLSDTHRIPRTILLHYSPFKAGWDWLILLLVIYTAIVTPYTAAFLMHEDSNTISENKIKLRQSRALAVIELIVDVMFIIDLIVNLRTTYVKHNEELVTRGTKIAKHYLKRWFLIDVTAAIPFDILFSFIQAKGGGEIGVIILNL
ncbi:unnamed protein product [Didymodactylos carnosus]|uniref:LOV domain-containing protein n=1 Tax=Didymodactylos carnosus TaxID=1234261 RepID=A0A8S2GWU2_9BILA|nr:unnamed protein product [Didymodactylos carnosus]CAF3573082.1 unnamed protein product [Didymodactylos carnosus]